MSSASGASSTVRSPETGMAIMVLAMMLVPVGDALAKTLTDTLSPFEIAFWRFAFQTVVLAGILAVLRHSIFTGPFGWLVLGGFSSATLLSALVGAFVVMPIATAIAIFFVEPLILTVLSALILKEKTGWRRYVAVLVGLIGAVVVIRPSWDIFGWRALLPLLAAFAYALNAIVIRRVSTDLSSVAIQFWLALFASLFLAAGMLVFDEISLLSAAGSMVDLDGPWGMLVIMGLLSAFTFFLISEAFRRTPASTLAPFQYLEIIGATALGYFVFGDFPDFWTWVGTAIILGSGLYVFYRERQLNRAKPHPGQVH